MNEPDPEPEITAGHYFELLDRTHVASMYLQSALGTHPVLCKHDDLRALYESAVEKLESLYQAVGWFTPLD